MTDLSQEERDLRRFRRLVRSKIREHATRQKEAPGLTLWVSQGTRAGKAAAVRVGAAKSAGDVAVRTREAILEARPAFAAMGRQLHQTDRRTPARGYGLVVASASGLVETWRTTFTAGVLGPWEPGEFDPGVTVDLLRSAWVEVARVEKLEGLVDRLRALADDVHGRAATDEATAKREKIGELGEGLMAFLGHQGAAAPRESEGEFVAYVERWLSDEEKGTRNV